MKIRKITGVIALFLCFQTLGAQNFATRHLKDLSDLINCPLPQQSDIFDCPQIRNFPLLIEYDHTGTVSHLGVSLFSETMKEAVGKPVCDFQERLFLELFLQKDETKVQKLLDEYKVLWEDSYLSSGKLLKLLENSLLFALKEATNYALTKDSLTWRSSWSDSTRNFSLRFLSNYDLILGMDKKEAEIWLIEQLQNFHYESDTILPPLVETGELEQLSRKVYVKRGRNLFVQGMNNNLYFSPDTVACAFYLLYDRKFPEESIVNLFNHPNQQAEGLNLQIKQVLYGGSQSYGMRLSDFQKFMGDDYEIYTGIVKCMADTVEFIVAYKSKWYNCSHLLHIQTTPQHLFNKTGVLNAKFTAFIPNHNIKDLFKDKEPSVLPALPVVQGPYKFACDSSQLVIQTQTELVRDTLPDPSCDIKLPTSNIKKIEKIGTICALAGGTFVVGGFIGMMFTSNTDRLQLFNGFVCGGTITALIGSIVIVSGSHKVNNTIAEYNNDRVNKNKAALNFGITQSGGVGITLKF